MIIYEDVPIRNTEINCEDMERFCSILESKNIEYSCKIFLEENKKYIYNYSHEEKNPFQSGKLNNVYIEKIVIESKYCNLEFGKNTKNIISFEGDENDEIYTFLYKQFDEWCKGLKITHRVDFKDSFNSFFCGMWGPILIFGICVGYYFLSLVAGQKSMLGSVLSTIFLGVLIIISFIEYVIGFKIYQIKIGRTRYIAHQKAFYFLLSSCVLPIIMGLIF